VIWALTGLFVYLGMTRLLNTDFEIRPDAMIIVSAIGIAINIVSVTSLLQRPSFLIYIFYTSPIQ
jgi:Co/Zn/Cd efflux system component